MSAPDVSVVVIGRNEGGRLRRCLGSLAQVDASGVGAVEVLYVDSSSTDGSPATAAALGARTIVVHPERPCAAVGRNAGWRAARHDLIFFLDGDTVVHPRFLSRALPWFVDPRIAVVWGHRRELHPEASIYNRVLDLDWIYPPGASEFCGGDAVFRRSALLATGGFDETLIAGEEPELCRRIRAAGGVIQHLDLPMTGHDLAIHHFSQYWRRAVRAGHAYAEVADRTRDAEVPLWQADARRNLERGWLLLAMLALGPLASVALASWWPLLGLLALLSVLVARSARRCAWKTGSLLTRLLYGVHSHLQQLPILVGQLGYRVDRRRGRRRRLIEYKGTH